MTNVDGYRIASIDPKTLGDDQVAEAARLQQVLMQERVPEDPLTPLEVLAARLRADTPGQWRAYFAARDAGDRVVGYGVVGRSLNEPENAHIRFSEIGVHPEHRRRGIGRALLRACVEACAGQGGDLVFMGSTTDRVPSGEPFARAVRASPGLEMRTNQLVLAEVDRGKVAEWARLDPEGYRIERADNVVPAALLPSYLAAANAMNDAPTGTMAWNTQEFTEQQARDREAYLRQAGMQWRLIVAVDAATGEGAGFTEVQHDPRVPHIVWQGGTGVAKAHRGHRLGLWMKAVMLERVFAEWPAARFIRTGNATTNEWMLAINTRLGFHHAWSQTLWQIPLAELRSTLGLGAAGAAAR